MIKKKEFGDHSIYTYDISNHKFLEYFRKIYNTDKLERLHEISNFYVRENISNVETELHKIFYNDIKSKDEFKKL